MPSPCLDATFHGRLNRVQFGIKTERERERKRAILVEEEKNFLIRINRRPNEWVNKSLRKGL